MVNGKFLVVEGKLSDADNLKASGKFLYGFWIFLVFCNFLVVLEVK